MARWNQGGPLRGWDTLTTINAMRALLPEVPQPPDHRNLITALRQTRVQALSTLFGGGDNWNAVPDIDLSQGFDTWLIYIVG